MLLSNILFCHTNIIYSVIVNSEIFYIQGLLRWPIQGMGAFSFLLYNIILLKANPYFTSPSPKKTYVTIKHFILPHQHYLFCYR